MRAAVGLLLVCSNCARTSQPPIAPPAASSGSAVRSPSGIVFPAFVAGFNRIRTASFTAQSADLAAAYDFVGPPGQIAATVYVHPSPTLFTVGLSPESVERARGNACNADIVKLKGDLAAAHLQAAEPRDRPFTIVKSGVSQDGRILSSSYRATTQGQPRTILTDLIVFCFLPSQNGYSTLEFRFSYPDFPEAPDVIAGFMGAFDWSGLSAR